MNSIDLCIVAGRRPELLQQTLRSFSEKIFSKLSITACYLNIDPVFGNHAAGYETANVVRQFFPNASVNMPSSANFSAAVKHVWCQTQSDFVFHLEDDWTADHALSDDIFSYFDAPRTMQVSFNHWHKHWNFRRDGEFHYAKKEKRFLFFKYKTRRSHPFFTTSPSILRGTFARQAGALLDSRYDPEKQFYHGVNPDLEAFVRPFQNYIYTKSKPYIITDTGRGWREERRIEKRTVNSNSIWVAAQ